MTPGRHGAVSVLIALLLSGCIKVGPDFKPPQATVADQWLGMNEQAVAHGDVEQAWWKVFGDPVLDQLVETAYGQNLTLQATGVRVLQARAQLGIAIGDLFPQTQNAFGSVTYNRQSARAPFQQGASSSLLSYWQAQVGVQAAWELDFWGRFRRAIEAADASLQVSVADWDNALVSLTGDVATNYVQIRTLEERLAIARSNVDVQRESLNIAEIRFQGGTTTERDVEQARTVLASTEASIPQFEASLQQTKNALCVLLGIPPSPLDEILSGSSGIPVAPVQVTAGIPADLLRRRPDVRSAELRAAAQSAQIGVAKADLYPAFSLTGNFGFLSTDWGHYDLTDIFLAKSRAWSVGPSVQWNFLNYGQITNNVRVQDAAFQALLADYGNTVLNAQREVEDGLVAFSKSQQRTEFLRLSSAAAARSQELAVLQYREGITDFTTVLTAEQNLLQQEDSLAVSRGDIPLGLIRTYRALGGGWEIHQDDPVIPAEVREAMQQRTDWGRLLRPNNLTQVGSQTAPPVVPTPDW